MNASLMLVLSLLTWFSTSAFASARAHILTEGRAFLVEQPDNVDRYEGIFQAEYENSFSAGKTFSFKLHPFIQVTSLPRAWGSPFIADPRELYAAAEVDSFYAHAGYFTLMYEGTDGINPMDIASMKYWGDPLRPITKASAGLHIGWSSNMFELEAAYIPEQAASSLPGESSAWLPRKTRFPLQSEDSELRLPSRVDYEYLPRQVLDHAFQHNYTGRAQVHTDYGDGAIAFFEGAADTPMIFIPVVNGTIIAVSPKFIALLDSPISVVPRYYRRRTVAGLLTVPAGEWIFRVSSRYDQPLGTAKQYTTYSGQTVAGVERTFNFAENMVTFILQGSMVQVPDSNSLISLRDVFDKAVMLGMRWAINDFWTTQLSGLYSTTDQSGFYSGEVSRTFAERWTAKVLVEVLEGPPQSLLGTYDSNDRLSVSLSRAF